MKKKISIHDIARHLKVSSATVSLVLNGKAEANRIRKEVADAITTYARAVDYRPNLVAKSLRTGKSRIIGMLVEGISNPFFAGIASYVEKEAYKAGYKLFYSSTENNSERARDLLRAFRERQVDAYIIAPTSGIEPEIKSIIDDNYPVIIFDRQLPALDATTIVIDNYKGAFAGVNHLYKNGFGHVALVTLDSQQLQMKDRERGYLEATKKAGADPFLLKLPYDAGHDENVKNIRRFLSEHEMLNGILFATNYLALAGLEAIRKMRYSMPDDIAVVAFDDISFFSLLTPSVTAVAQPVREIAHEIMQQLKLKLSGPATAGKNKTTILKTELIIRESSFGGLKVGAKGKRKVGA